ncbi:unnamed protein product [Nesidiocoris tenuis]|uniref:Uncharacterized protein n=1 Tax=Nesidiocoris tenuis TaxID=355587 RepID=A0A6H5GXI4_9HEMI|nr:unnamed protein product [Nesidiocoris tenuis]
MDVEEFPRDWRHRMQSAVFASQQPKGERTHNSAGREAIRGFRRFPRQGGQCCQHSRRNSDPRTNRLRRLRHFLAEEGRRAESARNPIVSISRRQLRSSAGIHVSIFQLVCSKFGEEADRSIGRTMGQKSGRGRLDPGGLVLLFEIHES